MSLSRLGVIENVSLKKTPTRDCSLVHCSAAVRSTTQGIPTTLISGYQWLCIPCHPKRFGNPSACCCTFPFTRSVATVCTWSSWVEHGFPLTFDLKPDFRSVREHRCCPRQLSELRLPRVRASLAVLHTRKSVSPVQRQCLNVVFNQTTVSHRAIQRKLECSPHCRIALLFLQGNEISRKLIPSCWVHNRWAAIRRFEVRNKHTSIFPAAYLAADWITALDVVQQSFTRSLPMEKINQFRTMAVVINLVPWTFWLLHSKSPSLCYLVSFWLIRPQLFLRNSSDNHHPFICERLRSGLRHPTSRFPQSRQICTQQHRH